MVFIIQHFWIKLVVFSSIKKNYCVQSFMDLIRLSQRCYHQKVQDCQLTMTFDLQLTTLHHSSSSKPGKSQSCVKCTLGWNVTNHSSGQYRGKESKQRLRQAGVCGHPSRPVKVCFCFFLSHKIPFFGTREAKCFGMNSMDPPQMKVITLCNKLEKVHTLIHKLQDVK